MRAPRWSRGDWVLDPFGARAYVTVPDHGAYKGRYIVEVVYENHRALYWIESELAPAGADEKTKEAR